MKKIAIITITSGLNYGNRLQNYALSKYINSLGLEVETLNNNGKEIIIKRWLKNIYNFILRRKYLIRKNNFAKFNKNIKFSKFYISNDNIPKLIENKYYAFIAGVFSHLQKIIVLQKKLHTPTLHQHIFIV